MEQFARAVADIFPMLPGESLDDYFARVRASDLKLSQRAMIAAELRIVLKSQYAERQATKNAWIAAARLAFNPGNRNACAICGQYDSVCEAHHVFPLGLQFDLGLEVPNQEFEWLCPSHHNALHIIIAALLETKQPHLEGFPPEERDDLDRLALRFVHLWTAVPGWADYRRRK